eukprot:g23697.t1
METLHQFSQWKTPAAYQNFEPGTEVVAITKEKVLGNLKGLTVDKSPSPDGLHPKQLMEITEETVEALEVMSKLDKVEPVDMIYLDFQKAFDKVQHRRLLNYTRARGVEGK